MGDGVASVKPGDRVLAGTRFNGQAELVTVRENMVYRLPEQLSFEEGAAFPVNYATAEAGLVVMGGLQEGERVLIHAAAGGVGISATQIAKRIGAEVFGTASALKHDAIRQQGVDHAIDYRSQDFAEEVRRLTRQEGGARTGRRDAPACAQLRKRRRWVRPPAKCPAETSASTPRNPAPSRVPPPQRKRLGICAAPARSILVRRRDHRASERMPKHLKAHDCRCDACINRKLFDVECMDREQVAVRLVSRGRGRPDVAGGAGVAPQRLAPAGSLPLLGSPAPAESSVTDAGMFATAQCQNPEPVGASGSKQVTAKLFVSARNPDHDSCGDTSSPPAPMIPDTWAFGSVSPSLTSVLVAIVGFRGADVRRRVDDDEVAFVTLTRFDSLDVIRRFAGDDHEVRVLEPKVLGLLSRYDDPVRHFETVSFRA